MNYENNWEIIEQIGKPGGQGTVFKVFEKKIKKETDQFLIHFLNDLKVAHISTIAEQLDEFYRLSRKRNVVYEDVSLQKALKVLHKPENARDSELAKERMKKEIESMYKNVHPNLIKIIDHDPDHDWFISEYYPNGTLDGIFNLTKGNILFSLKLIRPLIEAVATLHKNQVIHRDIKPQNIFIGTNKDLILGDFGLVFFEDAGHTRISKEFSNVGSRSWMPSWATDILIENVNATFDVFPLAKIIWCMISGKPKLQAWYFDETDNNLETLFPDKKKEMKLVNDLLSQCLVGKENQCLRNANILLSEIDKILDILESKYELLGFNEERKCKICGKGTYKLRSKDKRGNFQLDSMNDPYSYNIFYVCNYCGNVQLFFCDAGERPLPWKDEKK